MPIFHSLCLHVQIAKIIRPVVLGLILCASHARTFSLIHGYSAPLEIYKLLEHHDDVGTGESLYLAVSHFTAKTSDVAENDSTEAIRLKI